MNPYSHSPKTILITGAARRIGKTIAELLHQQGMNVVIHYHQSKTEASELCLELNKLRKKSAIALEADLANFVDLKRLIAEAHQYWGRLDGLINNASAFYPTPLSECTETHWEELFNVNLKAPFFLAQFAAPWLKLSKGSLINITDIHAQKPFKHYSIYSMSKAGLDMATRVLAKELAPDVRVNAIAPGSIIWPEGKNSLNTVLKKDIISRIPLQTEGCPQDIAKAVLFLIESADYITGQTLAVDGGRLLNC